MYNVGTIKCLTCRTVWFNEIFNRTLTTVCIWYGGHVFWKRVIIHNLERYYHKTIPSSFRPYKLHSISEKYPFHNSYPYVHFSDCMVLGHNLEENPQRMIAINFVYIGSASGIFGEKTLYKDAWR